MKIKAFLFYGALFIGLMIRILSLSHAGTGDMNQYKQWGDAVLQNGLSNSFEGIYFPIQYQLFEFCSWIVKSFDLNYLLVFKSLNLLFECGNLVLLSLIFKKMAISKNYLLIYWLHPWFLNVFSLGYVDCQFTFFILLVIYFSFQNSSKHLLLASFFLGIAFLLKPQVQIIILTLSCFSFIQLHQKKNISSMLYFIFPLILFVSYSLYFYFKQHDLTFLFHAYTNVSNVMPCLNAQFLNLWFVMAYFLKESSEPIYSVSDQIILLGIQVKYIAAFLLIMLSILFCFLLNKNRNNTYNTLLAICAVTSLLLPFIMTSAHENHLYLASVVLIPFYAKNKQLAFRIAFQVLLALQFVNLFGYYGTGKYFHFVSYYNYQLAFVLSILAFICFLICLFQLIKTFQNDTIDTKQDTIFKQNIKRNDLYLFLFLLVFCLLIPFA